MTLWTSCLIDDTVIFQIWFRKLKCWSRGGWRGGGTHSSRASGQILWAFGSGDSCWWCRWCFCKLTLKHTSDHLNMLLLLLLVRLEDLQVLCNGSTGMSQNLWSRRWISKNVDTKGGTLQTLHMKISLFVIMGTTRPVQTVANSVQLGIYQAGRVCMAIWRYIH